MDVRRFVFFCFLKKHCFSKQKWYHIFSDFLFNRVESLKWAQKSHKKLEICVWYRLKIIRLRHVFTKQKAKSNKLILKNKNYHILTYSALYACQTIPLIANPTRSNRVPGRPSGGRIWPHSTGRKTDPLTCLLYNSWHSFLQPALRKFSRITELYHAKAHSHALNLFLQNAAWVRLSSSLTLISHNIQFHKYFFIRLETAENLKVSSSDKTLFWLMKCCAESTFYSLT